MPNELPVAYFGALVHDGNWIVIGYNDHCHPTGKPVATFPFGVAGMLDAIADAQRRTDELKVQRAQTRNS